VKGLLALIILAALLVLTALSLTGSSGLWRDASQGWGSWANWLLGVLALAGGLVWWLDWRKKKNDQDE